MRFFVAAFLLMALIPMQLLADSESYKAKVVQLMKDANAQNQMMQVIQMIAKQFAPLIQKQMDTTITKIVQEKKLGKEDEKKLREYTQSFIDGYFPYLQQTLSKNIDKLYEINATIYRKHFSENELDKIIELTHEPVMRKFTSIAPTMMQENMAATQPFMSAMVGQATKEYVELIVERLKGAKDI